MPVLYLLTAPEPALPGTDATFQEVAALRSAFGGKAVNLCPRKTPGSPFPLQLFGLHRLPAIWKLERETEVNHIYHSVLYPFPILRLLKNPIVYTVLASLRESSKPARLAPLARLARIVVSSERDAEILGSWGLSNYSVVLPGIKTSHLTPSTLPINEEIVLLMASAPWIENQFDAKGVDTLLDAASMRSSLKLIFLWRGLLEQELRARIASRGIGNQVEVVTARVDIDSYLRRAHAAVLLAKRGDIVKAYPHSLLEALVAGKPVILSESLPMADDVRKHGCGIVMNEVTVEALLAGLDRLRTHYDEFARKVKALDPGKFSEERLVADYRRIYESCLANR
jgi:glycosyltransferase involved in cell wall biosynthesis